MTTQMIVRIDSQMKDKLSRLAKAEGKTNSQIIRELIESYIQERDISGYIDNLWNRTGLKLQNRGVELSDVEKAIKEVRREKNESRH